MQIFLPRSSPPTASRMEKASSSACVGCSCVPSPALTMLASMRLARKWCAPGAGWRMTTISTFIARMLFTVSSSVSPFLTEELAAEKLTVSALNRFSASSKLMRVRVEFSKKRLATVVSRRLGTFLMGRLMTSLNSRAVSRISSTSPGVRYLMPRTCLVESCKGGRESWSVGVWGLS